MRKFKKFMAMSMALAVLSTSTAVTSFAASTETAIPMVNAVTEGEEETPSIITRTMGSLEMTVNLEKTEVLIKETTSDMSMEFKKDGIYIDGTIIEAFEDEDDSETEYEATQEDFEFIMLVLGVLTEIQTDKLIFTDNVIEVKSNLIENTGAPAEYFVQFGKNIKSITPDLIIAPDSKVTIEGYKGTAAEVFAAEQNYTFIALDETADIPAKSHEKGDINGDGAVDSSDASSVLAGYSAIQTGGALDLSDEQKKAADVNGDSVVDSSDASEILRYYADLSTGKNPTWNNN